VLIGREGTEEHHSRVVDQDVGAAKLALHPLGRSDHRPAIGDIRLDRNRVLAELGGQRLDAIDTPGEQSDAVAVTGQSSRGRLANARRGTGDDRDTGQWCSQCSS